MPGTIVGTPKELARTFERDIGGRPIARRRWALNLSDDTLTSGGPPSLQTLVEACVPGAGAGWGVLHPELAFLGTRKFTVNERFEDDPYKVEVIAEYGLITAQELLHPTSRAAEWSMESQPGEVPALFYYDGSGNNTKRPLTNSAFDYFPGLVTEEQMVRIKIKKNFGSLSGGINVPNPSSWLQSQGFVNSDTYFGCVPHTLKVVGVDVQYTVEEYQGSQVAYYQTTASLLYRQSSHNLLLPDVGFNFLNGNEKRRAMVFDWKNNEWVASPNPVGLDGSGAQTFGAPAIVGGGAGRRIHPETSFSIFGNPPS